MQTQQATPIRGIDAATAGRETQTWNAARRNLRSSVAEGNAAGSIELDLSDRPAADPEAARRLVAVEVPECIRQAGPNKADAKG